MILWYGTKQRFPILVVEILSRRYVCLDLILAKWVKTEMLLRYHRFCISVFVSSAIVAVVFSICLPSV